MPGAVRVTSLRTTALLDPEQMRGHFSPALELGK